VVVVVGTAVVVVVVGTAVVVVVPGSTVVVVVVGAIVVVVVPGSIVVVVEVVVLVVVVGLGLATICKTSPVTGLPSISIAESIALTYHQPVLPGVNTPEYVSVLLSYEL
jgi:hypothetical protein